MDIRADRFGVTRYRLVVYPPGISESERRRVRVARGWPLWGALVWVVCELWLTHVTGPWTALAISTVTYLGVGLTAVLAAGPLRGQVRTMGAAVMVGQYEPEAAAARDKLIGSAQWLIEADDALAKGRATAADHELVWWGVYNAMTPPHRVRPHIHWSERGAS
jgi:hypothetical protein